MCYVLRQCYLYTSTCSSNSTSKCCCLVIKIREVRLNEFLNYRRVSSCPWSNVRSARLSRLQRRPEPTPKPTGADCNADRSRLQRRPEPTATPTGAQSNARILTDTHIHTRTHIRCLTTFSSGLCSLLFPSYYQCRFFHICGHLKKPTGAAV